MKYGDQLEQESVPEWSLHNVDYNSLKHEIKVHTTRDQATARTIPGQQDAALHKFEGQLYNELCNQHDRVDMFVSSKADEISRRLEYLSDQIQRLIVKCAEDDGAGRFPLKRQRRFAKYEREVLRCGEDINALSRFINAQVTAFRKITKKYKKWTGSTTLGSRFRDGVLSNPKSFTRRDLTQLQSRYDDVLAALRTTAVQFSEPSSPSSAGRAPSPTPLPQRGLPAAADEDEQGEGQQRTRREVHFPSAHEDFAPLPPPQQHYWNEYDDGSENGGGGGGNDDDVYAIYCDPNDDDGFPGAAYVRAVLGAPLRRVRSWFGRREPGSSGGGNDDEDDYHHRPHHHHHHHAEHRGLLGAAGDADERYHSAYGSTIATPTMTDDAYSSSDEYFPSSGYAVRFARGAARSSPLPSIAEQRATRYRERVLLYGTVGCFVGAFILLGAAALLVATGRHRLRVEVDAGAAVGVAASLFCGCCALGMTLYRRDRLGLLYRLGVWVSFFAVCVLNGMLLVVVVGSAA